MRRESHRRRGLNRESSGGWGHRAVYLGAVVAVAAVFAGFGAAVVVYGPLGSPTHQLVGTTATSAPQGVYFGNAQIVTASSLNLTNASGFPTWNWTNPATNQTTGPCNGTGTLANNDSFYYNDSYNATDAYNISGGGNVTLVCLNAVIGGNLTATWYNATNGSQTTFNTYNATNGIPNGSYYTSDGQNVSSCNQWTGPFTSTIWNQTHIDNATTFLPCGTYYEMNNNTTWISSFGGLYNGSTNPVYGFPDYNNSTLWSWNQSGYAPADLVYEVPVVFTNASINGTYEITLSIGGVTPVAQSFFFNDSLQDTGVTPGVVLFTFDMTAAWLFDAAVFINATTGAPGPANVTTPLIYGAIGVTSAIVTECLAYANGSATCPVAVPQDI